MRAVAEELDLSRLDEGVAAEALEVRPRITLQAVLFVEGAPASFGRVMPGHEVAAGDKNRWRYCRGIDVAIPRPTIRRCIDGVRLVTTRAPPTDASADAAELRAETTHYVTT